ncbi:MULTISPECIES: hypothetical protein [unclassified Haloparvum]
MDQYITADDEERLSPVVVVATILLLGLFGLAFLYRIGLTLV